jgi:hypothetical protein
MISNIFNPTMESKVSAYAANGLAEHFREAFPKTFAIATRVNGAAPKLFSGGLADWPAIVSANFDPSVLKMVPWQTRHFVAGQSDAASAHAAIEEFAANPNAVASHDGLDAAYARFEAWTVVDERLATDADKETIKAEQQQSVEAQDAAFYDGLYGPTGVVGGSTAAQTAKMRTYSAAQTKYGSR